jgi:hypothetical protein
MGHTQTQERDPMICFLYKKKYIRQLSGIYTYHKRLLRHIFSPTGQHTTFLSYIYDGV